MSQASGWEYQSIPIDFEVWKALSSRLESPSDSFNSVLRRAFGLKSATVVTTGRAWQVDGVTFPHGTEFKARHKGREFTASVRNGALEVNGKQFESPSPAAIEITGTSVNGWKFWHCRFPGTASWVTIDGLRQRR